MVLRIDCIRRRSTFSLNFFTFASIREMALFVCSSCSARAISWLFWTLMVQNTKKQARGTITQTDTKQNQAMRPWELNGAGSNELICRCRCSSRTILNSIVPPAIETCPPLGILSACNGVPGDGTADCGCELKVGTTRKVASRMSKRKITILRCCAMIATTLVATPQASQICGDFVFFPWFLMATNRRICRPAKQAFGYCSAAFLGSYKQVQWIDSEADTMPAYSSVLIIAAFASTTAIRN